LALGRRLPLALLVLVLVLAACGGGSKHATAPTTAPTTTDASGCTPAAPPAARAKKAAKPSARLDPAKTYEVTMQTNCGSFTIRLAVKTSPETTASFASLARKGFFDGTVFHRIVPGFVIQGGDPTGTGQGGPGYTFGIENAPKDGKYPTGVLAMARTQDPNSNGGQFFITYKETQLPTTGGGYTIFGKVTKGLDIVDKIAANKALPPTPTDGTPVSPISILSVSVTEKKA
jgi:peptidyl-prolyl cis-trans isomerase B (cyclophilin B)